MSLRGAFGGGRLAVRPLPKTGLTARLSATLSNNGFAAVRPIVDLDTVADRFVLCLERGDNPTVADWNRIAWCLWNTKPAIAENYGALDALLKRVARMERKRPYRQLASAYLADFTPGRPQLEQVAQVLAICAPMAGDPWRQLQEKYGLFDGATAVRRVAKVALNENIGVQRLLTSLEMGGALIEAGFAEAAHREGLTILRTVKTSNAAEHLDLIRRWCLRSDGTLIYKNCRTEMARALVDPFDDPVPEPISDFLVSLLGDPRVKPAGWIGMDDIAERLRRGLTGKSLRQFFDVVDKVAQPSQWRYRRAFWTAFHEAGLIRDAWVVFGPDGAADAKRSFGNSIPFGLLQTRSGAKQIQRNHAVLLMDLEQCFVADWSHNGRCNIWSNSDPSRPQLHKQRYTSPEVMRPLTKDQTEVYINKYDMFSHVGSDSYVWQDRVARRLQELIGVRVPQSAYRVR